MMHWFVFLGSAGELATLGRTFWLRDKRDAYPTTLPPHTFRDSFAFVDC